MCRWCVRTTVTTTVCAYHAYSSLLYLFSDYSPLSLQYFSYPMWSHVYIMDGVSWLGSSCAHSLSLYICNACHLSKVTLNEWNTIYSLSNLITHHGIRAMTLITWFLFVCLIFLLSSPLLFSSLLWTPFCSLLIFYLSCSLLSHGKMNPWNPLYLNGSDVPNTNTVSVDKLTNISKYEKVNGNSPLFKKKAWIH